MDSQYHIAFYTPVALKYAVHKKEPLKDLTDGPSTDLKNLWGS